MTSVLNSTRFSILDRSRTRQGQDESQALRDTVQFARQAEGLGYHRFWVSEHHSVPGVAGSAPTVLAAAVAAATSRIRVGTGGVMLPNHQPLVVAEQFGTLEALYPRRIDMGLGRSVGFTGGIRRALGHGKDDADEFAAQLGLLLGYFSGAQTTHPGVHARPAEGLRVPAFILATGAGADLAADFGVPLVIAAVKGEDDMLRLIDRYRERFRPSGQSASRLSSLSAPGNPRAGTAPHSAADPFGPRNSPETPVAPNVRSLEIVPRTGDAEAQSTGRTASPSQLSRSSYASRPTPGPAASAVPEVRPIAQVSATADASTRRPKPPHSPPDKAGSPSNTRCCAVNTWSSIRGGR